MLAFMLCICLFVLPIAIGFLLKDSYTMIKNPNTVTFFDVCFSCVVILVVTFVLSYVYVTTTYGEI